VSFTALTVAGLLALFVLGAPEGTPPRLADLRLGFLLPVVASALLDVILGAWRLQIFIRRIRPGISFWLPVRADLAGRFISAVTPSQSGGGPAQVYVLHRGGIPVPETLSFLVVNFISTLLFILLAGGGSVWLFRDQFGEGVLRRLIQYGFALVAAGLVLMLVAIVRPDLVSRPLERIARRSGEDGLLAVIRRVAGLLVDSLELYRSACRRFVRESAVLPVASFGGTILLYLNKFALAWLIMRGLGVERDFVTTVALMTLIHTCVFLAPTPGGSGITEVATGAFLSILLPDSLLGPFTLVYRLLIVYLPAAAGAVILHVELTAPPDRSPAHGSAAPVLPSAPFPDR
jgi:hypothetical protein